MDKERLNNLGQYWLGEEIYQGLRRFFQHIWEETGENDYCIFLARRCYNLHELFLSTFGKKDYSRGKYALSNNAILLKGRELAFQYFINNKLPSIMIVDDVLIHGRSLTFFLYRLEQKIRSELIVLGASQEQLSRLYLALVHAVKIRVYFENSDKILLNEVYRGRMESSKCVTRQTLHRFSQGVSQILVLSDVANTSFVLSTEGALEWGDDPVDEKWTRLQWTLRERKSTFYYHVLPAGASEYLVFSVRIREPRTLVGARWIPFLFTGEPKISDVPGEICSLMEDTVSEAVVAPFREIFFQKEVVAQQAQLVQLILSIVVLYWFCKKNVDLSSDEMKKLGYICDVKKISQNFSVNKRFSKALKHLFKEDAFMRECYVLLPQWFSGLHVPSNRIFCDVKSSARDNLYLNRIMENKMYLEGLQSERFAFLIDKTGRAYSPIHDDLPPLSVDDFINHDDISIFHLYHCLSSLLMLADSGVTSLKPQVRQDKIIYQVLRAGEQALFCKPRQLALYMPALILIEEKYRFFGNDWVVRRIQEFQEYLKKSSIVLNEPIPELDKFAEDWYKTGEMLAAWWIPLLYSMDGREVFAEGQRQEVYLEKMKFLQKSIWDTCKVFLEEYR